MFNIISVCWESCFKCCFDFGTSELTCFKICFSLNVFNTFLFTTSKIASVIMHQSKTTWHHMKQFIIVCKMKRLRSDCAYAQSYQNLFYLHLRCMTLEFNAKKNQVVKICKSSIIYWHMAEGPYPRNAVNTYWNMQLM